MRRGIATALVNRIAEVLRARGAECLEVTDPVPGSGDIVLDRMSEPDQRDPGSLRNRERTR
jgi:hypothetical protein